MYTVVNDIKRSFAVFSAIFLTLITSKVRGQDHCRSEALMNCSKPLSVLDSGLNFVSSKADLDKICPSLIEAVRCIHEYTRFCMNPKDRKHFKKLFHGTGLTVHELCREGKYQEEYLKHAPCMKEVEKENEVCFKRYTRKMNEIQSQAPIVQNISESDLVTYQKKKREAADEGIKSVCCSFQEYVECSTHATRRKCGNDAAHFSKRFLDKMSSSMIQLHCSEYGHRECGLISSSNVIQHSILAVILLSILTFVLR